MQVILKDDVKNLGNALETVKVKSGYARNYLIPQGLAELATPGNLKRVNEWRNIYMKKQAKKKAGATMLQEKLQGVLVKFMLPAGESDKLYGSVTNQNIADELLQMGIEIDKRKFLKNDHLKTIGDHVVQLRLHADIVADIKVAIEKEEPEAESTADAPAVAKVPSE